METHVLSRASLGQVASLGDLYDARTDSFCGYSMFNTKVPDEVVKQKDNNFSEIRLIDNDRFSVKCDELNVNGELRVSLIAGLLILSGSGRYLNDHKSTARAVRSSLIYSVKTKGESINTKTFDQPKNIFDIETLNSGIATHVVVGITWGVNSIVTCECSNTDLRDVKEIEGNLSVQLQKLSLAISGKETVDFNDRGGENNDMNFSVKIFGDILPPNQELPTTFEQTVQLMKKIPDLLSTCKNSGKGKALMYRLVPLPVLSSRLKLRIGMDSMFISLEETSLLQVIHVFEEMNELQQQISDFFEDAHSNRMCVRSEDLATISSLKQNFFIQQSSFKSKLAKIVTGIRSGKAKACVLDQIIKEYHTHSSLSPRKVQLQLENWCFISEKIQFAKSLVSNGAKYIGNGVSLDVEILKEFDKKTFIIYLQDNARAQDPEGWKANRGLFFQELKKGGEAKFFAVDCDIHPHLWPAEGITLIEVLENGHVLVKNLLLDQQRQQQQFKDSAWTQCIVAVHSTSSKPSKRAKVVIPCLGRNCSSTSEYEWVCRKCKEFVEYGFDEYFYCSCGRSLATTFEFKCPETSHGIGFEMPEETFLKQFLSRLKPLKDLNILILGETGVGKSTWINGFANFSSFQSLEEAEKQDELLSLIPSTFNVCDNDYNEIVVNTGNDKNEVQASGQSATQECKTYFFDVNDVRVRLIDTPGIGDTRGYAQDKMNFQNVLSTISHLEEIHGICILLKPNNARLNVMFRFCIKELLTYLHRDASQNIVFCFTNSRGTFYKPGDTLPALRTLLKENKEVEIPLSSDTIYCYDSEAYRFLAACKNNPPAAFNDNERKDFSLSWEKSIAETLRMLQHIRTLKPHPIQSTMNLNHARELVHKLTRPLAEIGKSIQTKRNVMADHLEEIRRTQANIVDLQKQVRYEVPALRIIQIDHPKTVCTNTNCKEYFGPDKAIRYTSVCHDPCQLKGVTSDVVGHEGLLKCWAMDNGFCRNPNCRHSYREHMHYYYETEEITKEVEDQAAKELLKTNVSAVVLKEHMIRSKKQEIEELDKEFSDIQQASVRFACFLKRNAITPYNDAMSEYLKYLIKEEEDKVSHGGADRILATLRLNLEAYEQEIRILEENMELGKGTASYISPAQVQEEISKLYTLKNSGKGLMNALEAVNRTQKREAEYQEISGNPKFSTKRRHDGRIVSGYSRNPFWRFTRW